MKRKEYGWQISQMSGMGNVAAAPGSYTGTKRKVPEAPVRSPKKKRPARSRAKGRKNQWALTTTISVVAIIAFLLCAGILVQHAVISSLDNDVRQLQSQYDEKKALNDSKEGQLVTSRDYNQIEAQARGYGMTEATAQQKVSESVTSQTLQESPEENTAWYVGLFN
ncbi:hypothetical protein [Eubacterium barkeri]|uniref:Cell division protein FtsL n=1 Tax=Eubacterium barkeri TaxID=1528 RepID=A0A1H3EFA3_EUBBA|nr:hypothetical protein [Eubacterium barkeri]SDX77297.1 hypothetical protein SAMN04488579_10736 [Eubacterium barkeri]